MHGWGRSHITRMNRNTVQSGTRQHFIIWQWRNPTLTLDENKNIGSSYKQTCRTHPTLHNNSNLGRNKRWLTINTNNVVYCIPETSLKQSIESRIIRFELPTEYACMSSGTSQPSVIHVNVTTCLVNQPYHLSRLLKRRRCKAFGTSSKSHKPITNICYWLWWAEPGNSCPRTTLYHPRMPRERANP